MNDRPCLQEQYALQNRCFGCGPANAEGLRIRSYAQSQDDPHSEVVAEWSPQPHHEAFEGMLNGGIIGALLDCHSNWTAAFHLMKRDGSDEPPCTVTADYHVRLRRPTSSHRSVRLSARAVSSEAEWVTVEATLSSEDRVTATCTGRFVAVGPGHPAYHRW